MDHEEPNEPLYQDLHAPHAWHDEEFAVASSEEEPQESIIQRLRRRFLEWVNPGESERLARASNDFPQSDDEVTTVNDSTIAQEQRRKQPPYIEPTGSSVPAAFPTSTQAYIEGDPDEFQIAGGSLPHFGPDADADQDQVLTKGAVLNRLPADEFEIADKRKSKSIAALAPEAPPVPEMQQAPFLDDVAVSEEGFAGTGAVAPVPIPIDHIAAAPKERDEFQTASIPRHQSFKDTLQDQIEDLASRLDVSGKVLESQRIDELPPQDDHLLTIGAAGKPKSIVRSLVFALLLFLKILAGLPLRCLTQAGSLQEQSRPRWEAVLAAIPALYVTSIAYSTVIYYKTSDLLRERNLFSRISDERLASQDWVGAELATRRACLTSSAPSNLWKYSQVLVRSPNPAERFKGYALVSRLASPEYDNLADAHIYLAKEFLKTRELKVEDVPRYLGLVQNHLRSALATDPNRLDALEILLDLLMTIEDEAEVERLVAPRVGQWPLGYYYLSRISFSRGDRINQKIQAGFSVKYYESVPKLLLESAKDRERYMLSLALAGQWDKAEPIMNDWLKSLEGDASIANWRNRFLAIRLMERLDLPPDETRGDVAILASAIDQSPKQHDLWNVFSRFVDRKSSDQEKFFGTAMQLIDRHPDALDSDDYMLWGNIARKWGHNAESRKLLEKSIALNAKNVIAANNLANILYKEPPRDYNRALELIEGVLAIEPKNPIYLETRGQILAILGQDTRAIEDLTTSLNTFPDVPEIHETLGKLLRRTGRTELAMSHERRLKQLRESPTSRIQSGQIIPKTK